MIQPMKRSRIDDPSFFPDAAFDPMWEEREHDGQVGHDQNQKHGHPDAREEGKFPDGGYAVDKQGPQAEQGGQDGQKGRQGRPGKGDCGCVNGRRGRCGGGAVFSQDMQAVGRSHGD